ncbi:hypothetical protein GCM10028791_27360 [Echinicola sediminis]
MINKKALFVQLGLFAILSILSGSSLAQSTIKVLSYNIWNGYDWGKDSLRRTQVLKWIDSRNTDIVAFQELCGYSDEKLTADAKYIGHEHSVLLKTSGYSVGVSSKYPIKIKERIFDNMHHGALHCEINGIQVFVVHLSPFSWEKRQTEADELLSRIKGLIANGEDVLVCGDFNALSPVDQNWYSDNKELLDRDLQSDQQHEHVKNQRMGLHDYSAMGKFLGAGLYDGIPAFVQNGKQRISNPTLVFAKNKREEEDLIKHGVRIDFILSSYGLANKCVSAEIINQGETIRLSDHYPVECVYQFD